MFKRVVLPFLALILMSQAAQASVVNSIGSVLNRALRWEQFSSELAKSFGRARVYDDIGSIGPKEVYFKKRIGPASTYDLDGFTIHLIQTGDARSGVTIQINAFVQSAADAKADKLKLLIEKALRNSGWDTQATAPYVKGVRKGVGVGPDHISLNNGPQNVQIAKFLEEMASLAERLKKEDFTSVISR